VEGESGLKLIFEDGIPGVLLPVSYPLCYYPTMARAKDANGLTHQQERFAQLVAAGATQSDAYRQAYNVSPDTPGTTYWDHASELARHALVKPRIAELKAEFQKAAVKAQAWNLDRLVAEAETNLALSRTHKQLGSANGALELIGRVTGIISDRPAEPQAPITRVVVVLNRGNDAGGRPVITEAAYEVLPMATEREHVPPAEIMNNDEEVTES